MNIKIEDTLKGDNRSRLEKYWASAGFEKIYKEFRKGTLPETFKNQIKDVRDVSKVFNLKGYQFGNWVSNEDRFNYLAALGICFYDLNQVLKFKGNNLGLNKNLGVAFGARGKSRALAHYEPGTNVINMTRYKNANPANPVKKEVRFVNSGGVGAFAHEYGHFLDYFFGSRVEPHSSTFSLSGGSSMNTKELVYKKKDYPIRYEMERIMQMAYFDAQGKPSAYFKRLDRLKARTYYLQRTEIFARLFEQYIAYKLREKKISNSFLTQSKYETLVYMTPREFKRVVPVFDQLLIRMRMAF
jgi:hypothetical protein